MVRVALTPAQFAAKSAQLQSEEGIVLTSPNAAGSAGGIVVKDGIVVAWSYDGAHLTATPIHHPLLIPDSMIETRLTGWLSA